MIYVGIDWADQKHDVYITDDGGKLVEKFEVKNELDGFMRLRDALQRLSQNKEHIVIGIEKDSGILFEFLLDQGYILYPLNPKIVNRNRARYNMSGAYDDVFDAKVIANLLRTDRHLYRPVKPDSEIARTLKILSRDRTHIVRQRVCVLNQLKSTFKLYFPKALTLFEDLSLPSSIDFLLSYPTPDQAASISLDTLEKFLKKWQFPYRRKKRETMLTTLHAPRPNVPEFIVKAKSRYAVILLEQLRNLNFSIEAYENEISRLVQTHPHYDIVKSLPSSGDVTVAKLIGEVGDELGKYANFSSVQCYGGTAPVTRRSGKTKKAVVQRKACNTHLKDAMYLFSFGSLRTSYWARRYYDELRSRGNTHSMAVRAVSNKWLKIIFTLFRRKERYDEVHHLKIQEKYRQAH